MIDLRSNYPLLPGQGQQLQAALAALPLADDDLRPPPPGGHAADREPAAAWLARPGYPVDPHDVQLSCGGHHALTVSILAARLAGATVVVDPATYSNFLALAQQFNIRVVACALDQAGMLPDALAALCRQTAVRAVYLMPTMHNPLAFTMPLARRQELVAVARRHDLLLLEDDAYGFLEPDAPLALAHLAPERCFSIFSFTKPCAAGLKLAYILAPRPWQAALATAIRLTSSGEVVLFARLASAWLRDGTLRQLIARKQALAGRRQALVQRIVGSVVPYRTRPTGLHLWVPLAAGTNVAEVEKRLLAQGVQVVTSLSYQAEAAWPCPGLRVALGGVPDEALLAEGLTRLVRALQ